MEYKRRALYASIRRKVSIACKLRTTGNEKQKFCAIIAG
ncbi:hypothetical protein UUU_13330 [Klebsiella pneumoniae subsp. pneumoniae DSM 30104 = JCM 1662 = NBRC 14940]|nr:hypothetical protein UUU_13330 [Klebsiella pneumoniae subsp. pneumoniae DSM 30104 = JCM 1662 = NBRC 14940]